jgi:uncharacterized iron-regulated membrane protein
MSFNPRVFFRKSHRWGAVLIALPFLLVVISGLLLQVKKQVVWVQPETRKSQGKTPSITMNDILEAAKSAPEASVRSWDDIERIDARMRDGIVKVQCRNRYEVQVDFQTGAVVQVAYRRSDLIESLHDGSWFGDTAKLSIFLPVAVVVLGLWVSGMYLFALPYAVKWRRRSKARSRPAVVPAEPQ